MRALALLLLTVLLVVDAAVAQGQAPPPSSVTDSVDLGLVYRRAVIGRNAVRDQIDLCAEDADKLQTVSKELKPDAGGEEQLWKEWADALKGAGNDLVRCLRAFKRLSEIADREADELRKRWQGAAPKPTASARDTAEINKFLGGTEAETRQLRERASQMAKLAQKSVDDANSQLAQRGLGQVLLALPFAEALRL